jgi:hypothetical protein
VLGFLERRDSLLSRDAGEVIEKLVEGTTCLKIVEHRLDRDPRTYEHRRAAENFGVAMNDASLLFHGCEPTTDR